MLNESMLVASPFVRIRRNSPCTPPAGTTQPKHRQAQHSALLSHHSAHYSPLLVTTQHDSPPRSTIQRHSALLTTTHHYSPPRNTTQRHSAHPHLVRCFHLVVCKSAGNDLRQGCASRRIMAEQLIDVCIGDLDAADWSTSPMWTHVVQQVDWRLNAHCPIHSEPLCQVVPCKEPPAMSRINTPLNELRHGQGGAGAAGTTAPRKRLTAAVTLRLRRVKHRCECL